MRTLLEICEHRMEMKTYTYFRWHFNRWCLDFSRYEEGQFAFWIDLPFIHINNVLANEIVLVGANSFYHTVTVISGKILLWKIKI